MVKSFILLVNMTNILYGISLVKHKNSCIAVTYLPFICNDPGRSDIKLQSDNSMISNNPKA